MAGCRLWKHGSSSGLLQGQGLWVQQTWEAWRETWVLLEEVAISSTIDLLSRWPTNWRTIIPNKFSHCCKTSMAHNRFPNLKIQQRDSWRTPQGIWRPMGYDYRTSIGRGKQTLGGYKQKLVHQDPGERSSDPTRDWARLAFECPEVSRGGVGRQWPAAGSGHWIKPSWEPQHAGLRPFEGGPYYSHYPTVVWRQDKIQGGNTAPAISRKLSSVQLLSCVRLFTTPWTAAFQASLSITNTQSLLKLMSIESVMPPNHLILCYPFSSYPQSFPASSSYPTTQFFSSGGQSVGASASVLPITIQEWFPLGLTGLISCYPRDPQESSPAPSFKASILRHSAFFKVHVSHPYLTTGKNIALTRWTLVSQVMSLLFSMLPRFVIVFLPRSKYLLISWLQSWSAVILEPKKIKSVIVSPSICLKWWDRCHDLSFLSLEF